jgi:ankyrin repeat protein
VEGSERSDDAGVCHRERASVVKLLLKRGANIESKDYDSGTPLACTIAYRHEAVIKLLLEGNLVLNLASNLAVWTISQGLIFSPSGTRLESSEG